VTVVWKEPITSYQAQRAQVKLERQLERRPIVRPAKASAAAADKVERSIDYRVQESRAAGRIQIPSIDVEAIVVEGTDEEELKKSPGHYPMTHWPGQGKVIAIAGHCTTYGAWFRHIDDLEEARASS
jgi:sortase A